MNNVRVASIGRVPGIENQEVTGSNPVANYKLGILKSP